VNLTVAHALIDRAGLTKTEEVRWRLPNNKETRSVGAALSAALVLLAEGAGGGELDGAAHVPGGTVR